MHTSQALLLTLTIVSAYGQSTRAELFGTVRDPGGLPVPSASVDLMSTATGAGFASTTDTIGAYRFFALPPGGYMLSITKDGFGRLRREGIVLRVGDRVNLDFELRVGDVTSSIHVTAAAPLLQATRGTASFVVEQKKVVSLPLDGRNFVPLIALSPGVSLPPGNLLPRVNGSRPRTSEYIYDGISVLQPEPGQVAFYPIVDAIEEFRVDTNSPSAEYGRSNGGVIMVNQKSGTNTLHGSLFEFFRNEALNARNLFATTGDKPRFRRDQYGFVLGGPIQKNKTFFFADWQGTRLDTGVVRQSTIPTTAQKNGVFTQPVFDPRSTRQTASGYARDPFPGNTIPTSLIDAAARAAMNRYPAPNVFNGVNEATANNYRRVGTDTTAQDQFDLRLDRYLGMRHRFFGRYTYLRDDSRPATPLPDGSGTFSASFIAPTLTRADGIAAEHTWSLSPTSVNQLRFGFTRRETRRTPLAVPIYDIVGYQQLGPPANSNAALTTSVTQLIDNYSWSRGSHSLKAGTDIRLERLDGLEPSNPSGNYQFTNVFTASLSAAGTPLSGTGNSFASFLTGPVTRFAIDVQAAPLRPRATIAEFFLQDDWRATRQLTVNAGVRYTLNVPSTVAGDRGAVFNLNTQQLDYFGKNGFPRSARHLDKTNFGPRLGLAYRITESFVVRSAYSLTWIEQAGITTPFTTPLFPFVQTLTQQTFDNIHPAFVLSDGPTVQPREPGPDAGLGQGVFGVQRDNGSGYAQQWNLSLQKTFGDNWSVEAGYLGSKLTRLGVPDVNLNQLTVEQLAAHTPVSARPYPNFNTVTLYRNNTGHSTYHSLQARLEKRLSRGLTFSVAYTFSRLIDDAGAVFDSAVLTGPVANFQVADSYNKRLEKDVSTGNVPHILASSFVYDLPWGWQLAGIVRVQSGSPIAVTQATNLNAFAGFGIQRPNRIVDPSLPADQRTTGRYFNTAAFTQAPQFTIGNSSRNPVSGPGYRTADVMLGKTFALTERMRAEFRAEAFNVTNTPSWGNPNGSFGAPAFGTITSAHDPRVYEIVVKIHF